MSQPDAAVCIRQSAMTKCNQIQHGTGSSNLTSQPDVAICIGQTKWKKWILFFSVCDREHKCTCHMQGFIFHYRTPHSPQPLWFPLEKPYAARSYSLCCKMQEGSTVNSFPRGCWSQEHGERRQLPVPLLRTWKGVMEWDYLQSKRNSRYISLTLFLLWKGGGWN